MSLFDLIYLLLMVVIMQQNTVQAECNCKCICIRGCTCYQGMVIHAGVCMDKCAALQECVLGSLTCTSCDHQWCQDPAPPPSVATPAPVSTWDTIHCAERRTEQMYDVPHYYELILSNPTKVHLQDCGTDFDPNLYVYDMETMEEVSDSVCLDGDDCGNCENDQNHEKYTLDLPAGSYYVMIRACCGADSDAKGAAYSLRIDCTDSELTVNPTTSMPTSSPMTGSPTTFAPSRSPLFPGETHPPTTHRPTKSPMTKPPTTTPVKRQNESSIDSTPSYSILFSVVIMVIAMLCINLY